MFTPTPESFRCSWFWAANCWWEPRASYSPFAAASTEALIVSDFHPPEVLPQLSKQRHSQLNTPHPPFHPRHKPICRKQYFVLWYINAEVNNSLTWVLDKLGPCSSGIHLPHLEMAFIICPPKLSMFPN